MPINYLWLLSVVWTGNKSTRVALRVEFPSDVPSLVAPQTSRKTNRFRERIRNLCLFAILERFCEAWEGQNDGKNQCKN